jgi:hypothetical protein
MKSRSPGALTAVHRQHGSAGWPAAVTAARRIVPGAMVKRDETLAQANERLEAEALALAAANEGLAQELAEQRRADRGAQDDVHSLRSLASISSDWYWEQDADYRFTDFAAERGTRARATGSRPRPQQRPRQAPLGAGRRLSPEHVLGPPPRGAGGAPGVSRFRIHPGAGRWRGALFFRQRRAGVRQAQRVHRLPRHDTRHHGGQAHRGKRAQGRALPRRHRRQHAGRRAP